MKKFLNTPVTVSVIVSLAALSLTACGAKGGSEISAAADVDATTDKVVDREFEADRTDPVEVIDGATITLSPSRTTRTVGSETPSADAGGSTGSTAGGSTTTGSTTTGSSVATPGGVDPTSPALEGGSVVSEPTAGGSEAGGTAVEAPVADSADEAPVDPESGSSSGAAGGSAPVITIPEGVLPTDPVFPRFPVTPGLVLPTLAAPSVSAVMASCVGTTVVVTANIQASPGVDSVTVTRNSALGGRTFDMVLLSGTTYTASFAGEAGMFSLWFDTVTVNLRDSLGRTASRSANFASVEC